MVNFKRIATVIVVLIFTSIATLQSQQSDILQQLNGQQAILNDAYQAIFDSVNINKLSTSVKHLSGEESFLTENGWDSILTRHSKAAGIYKAQNYIQKKLAGYGYDVELQPFYFDKYFGDIAFAPDDLNIGWMMIEWDIYTSTDGGETWQLQLSQAGGIISFCPVNRNVIYAAGFNGLFLKTTNGGKDWIALTTPSTSFFDVHFVNENHGWICGQGGLIFVTTDGGSTWNNQPTATDVYLYDLFFLDEYNGWAVGQNGTVLFTDNGGTNWIAKAPGLSEDFSCSYFFNESNGFIGGSNGTLLQTGDGGQSWEKISLLTTVLLSDIDFADSLTGAIIGSSGLVLMTNDGGENWRSITNVPFRSNSNLDFLANSTLWVTGRDVFMKTEDDGLTWDSKVDEYVDFYIHNIIATKMGTVYPEQTYMLCAHYDSDSGYNSNFIRAPGADDNASGTAAVIEAARICSPYDFKHSIKFILFAAEENGLVGSRYFARDAFSKNEQILGVINLDMIAHDGNGDGEVEIHARDIASSQFLGSYVKDNIATWSLPLVPEYYAIDGRRASDHAAFWDWGYSAILLIEDRQDFAPGYHTEYDLFSDFNLPYYLNNSRLAIVSLAELAQIDDSSIPVLSDNPEETAAAFTLYDPYPNPFNQHTTITYVLPSSSYIRVSIYNIAGQVVATLVNDFQEAGAHDIHWEANDIGTGMYFIHINSSRYSAIKKCIVLK